MPNKFEQFANDVSANANPNGSFMVSFTPILMDFFTRLVDCLFSRFGGNSGVSTGPATDMEEYPAPVDIPPGAEWTDKAEAIQDRIRRNQSGRVIAQVNWGGYHPVFVRRGMATLRRTARDHSQPMSPSDIKQHVIATYDKADGMTVEELAETLRDEHESSHASQRMIDEAVDRA